MLNKKGNKKMHRNENMMKVNRIVLIILLTGICVAGYAQTDTRYNTDMNLPFNAKAGDYNPQTGDITLSSTDVSLPGRAGMNFSFGRIWSGSQANVFNMYMSGGNNALNSDTVEKYNHLGAGWRSTLPYIQDNALSDTAGNRSMTLFMGGGAYAVDRSAIDSGAVNAGDSNLIGYDLLDKRLYRHSAPISYESFLAGTTDLYELIARYNITEEIISDRAGDSSYYILILKDNSKLYFRADGKLMMQEDKSALNRIWYFYQDYNGNGETESRLSLVVDTIGREIRFTYSAEGNLASINWTIDHGARDADGNLVWLTDQSRSVEYVYASAEEEFLTADYWNTMKGPGGVIDYRTPYLLKEVRDDVDQEIGTGTCYDYMPAVAAFSYDKWELGTRENLSALITKIGARENADGYLNKRCLEWECPETDKHLKMFSADGFLEYYKISRQYLLNRHGNVLNDTGYTYIDEGEQGNTSQYQTKIKIGGQSLLYTYSLNKSDSKYQTLSSLYMETEDGFVQLNKYLYNRKRTKIREEMYRHGKFSWAEDFNYDSRGNLNYHLDKMGLETHISYHEIFSIPLVKTKTFSDIYGSHSYKTRNEVDENGFVVRQFATVSDREICVSEIHYNQYGNPDKVKNAEGNAVYTVYDSAYNCFPVKKYQHVTLDTWSNGNGIENNWQTEPDAKQTVRVRSWNVFNTDGTPWIQLDNEGYGIEYYYDETGTALMSIGPDNDDYRAFSEAVKAVYNEATEQYEADDPVDEFYGSPLFARFAEARKNNPRLEKFPGYQTGYVKNVKDLDRISVDSAQVMVSDSQNDGLGNAESEIVYADNEGEIIHSEKIMTYDNLGRMVATTDPDREELLSVTSVGGTEVAKYDKTWIIEYDDIGRMKKVSYPKIDGDKLADVKVIVYDDKNLKTTVIDPEGKMAVETADWNGNIIKIEGFGNVMDNPTPEQDRQIYTYKYDPLNRKIRFTDSAGIITEYRYDERNLLLEQRYYEAGLDSEFGSDFMEYNDLGQIIMKSDRKGQIQNLIYDEMGRNTEIRHYLNADNLETDSRYYTVKQVYDNRGNVVRINNQNLIEYFEYNDGNLITKTARKLTSGLDTLTNHLKSEAWFSGEMWGANPAEYIYEFNYEYNDAGMVTSMTYPDGSVHEYEYDQHLGLLNSISQQPFSGISSGFVEDIEYNKAGVVTRLQYANGTAQEWDFDNRKRISGIRIYGPGSTVIEDIHYQVDGSGNILSINENQYEYDGFNRITGAKTLIPQEGLTVKDVKGIVDTAYGTYNLTGFNEITVGGELRVFDIDADLNDDGRVSGPDHMQSSLIDEEDIFDIEQFTYDVNGNRLSLEQNGDRYFYEYGVRNRLESVWLKKEGENKKSLYIEYEYDENGNTLSRSVHVMENGMPAAKKTEFAYDTFNRLISSVNNEGITRYYYDNSGNRFVKQSPDGSWNFYLRQGATAVAMDIELYGTRDEENQIGCINRYVLSGELLAGRISKTAVEVDGAVSVQTETSYYHLDHLNSTKCVTDEDGSISVNYTYRAFGDQLKKLGEGDAKYTYGGKELDECSNLYYFNARYYDATAGRFINVDPVQDGTNWYVYCSNNPLSFVDPTGLADIDIQVKLFDVKDRTGKDIIDLKAIAIHCTDRAYQTSDEVRTYLSTVIASAHYVIDNDGKIMQLLPNDEVGYHVGGLDDAPPLSEQEGPNYIFTNSEYTKENFPMIYNGKKQGDGNMYSIGIEVIPMDNDNNFSPEAYNSLVVLTAYLIQQNGGADDIDVLRHSDIVNKWDPTYFADEEDWNEFLDDVEATMELNDNITANYCTEKNSRILDGGGDRPVKLTQ